ncbi:Vascular endothelial growth factor A-A [Caligus rogercresseyi]|uniref:Vascular endothelial growth factor A-A n=1 Tax=Caligus rogercresseyi TaxID=217165 RepID=A0A7T8GSL9_CALRO|nr:Vascular endothelial growth factor A-A [Caligus rogercresseyi]
MKTTCFGRVLVVVVAVVVIALAVLPANVHSGSCSSGSRQRIHSSEITCGLRPVLVDLSLSSLEDNRVSRIIPGSVFVDRCIGACDSRECVPSRTENMTLEVMAVLTRYAQGEWNTVCTGLRLEKHVECICSCPQKAEACALGASYDSNACQCMCRDRNARSACLRSGKIWIERTCGCVCPQSSWVPCGTGFTFDYREQCSCVRAYNLASGNSVTLVVLALAIGSLSLAGSVLYVIRFLQRRASEQRRLRLRMRLREAFGSSESLDDSL